MFEGNHLPVKLHQKGGLLVATLPLPGLEPQDISISIEANNTLTINGAQRDVGPNEKDGLILEEWHIGPYQRELSLPCPVDGLNSNLTYNNGVLVVSMPQSDVTKPANLRMERLSSTSGIHYGHTDSGSLEVNQ